MDKRTYLQNQDVQGLINYMVSIFDSSPFHHSWVSYHAASTGVKKGSRWTCGNLKEAIDKYHWLSYDPISKLKFTSLSDTQTLLERLSNSLKDALQTQNTPALREVCAQILQWGGVESRKYVAQQFKDNDFDVVNYLQGVLDTLQLDTINLDALADTGNDRLIVDSGTTKIYSLLIPGFVIFDSRVGCAMALIVSRYWQNKNTDLDSLPSLFRFMWGGHTQSRNPNPNAKGQVIFKPLSNVGVERARQNIQLSWLLDSVASQLENRSYFTGKSREQIVRNLEAGLFMIGYGVDMSDRPLSFLSKIPRKDKTPNLRSISHGIYQQSMTAGLSRQQTIQRFVLEGNLKASTASSYYQYFKKSGLEPHE
jgi:hypothetical protein